jgi:outer membrane receptor protein involved in Fe transport
LNLFRNLRLHAVVMGLLTAALTAPAFAQLDTGSIQGTVRDASGAVIPNAKVTCTDLGTQQAHVVQSNAEGQYTCPSLPVAIYSVRAEYSGFNQATITGIHLNASESHRADLTMRIGAATQNVTVTANQVQVNTLTSELGTTIDSKQVADLPLNGRDFTDLTALVPGSVISAPFGNTSLGGAETSFAGANILLDGADATRIDTNATSMQLGREAARITRASVDDIAEFHILQSDYSAEYGRSIGDVVNVITKSGTNALHGEAFDFLRNNALDAKNYFSIPGQSTPLRLNQFGGNLGGPIEKDKIFYFTNYEGVRQTITNSQQFSVLNAAERAQAVPAVQPIINAIPVGNAGADGPYFDFYNAALIDTLREDTGSIKVDWDATNRSKFYARYNINDSNTITTYGPAAGQVAPTPARSQFLKLSYTWTGSSTLLNEGGFAINSNKIESYGGGGNFPILTIGCFFCNIGVLPGPALFAAISPETSYQYLDTLTKVAGRHTFKAGIDFRHNLTDRELGEQEFLDYAGGGGTTQSNISALTSNTGGFALSSIGYPMTRFRNTNYDFFGQDDWRITQRLTLNLGLRYEYNTVLHERDGHLANFDIATQTMGAAGAQLYSPDRTDFAPRVGFSWDPTGHGITVVRGGFGIFYMPQLTGAITALTNNLSNNISINILQLLFGTESCTPAVSLAFPVSPQLPTCTPAAPKTVYEYDPNTKDTYSEHWSLGVQQQLVRNVVLDMSYAGNRGLKLPAGAAFTGLQYNIPDPLGVIPQRNANYSNEYLFGDYLDSNYNSLQVALRGHLSRLTFDANYTWSHEFDDGVNIFSNFDNPTNPKDDFAEGDIDVRNNFTSDVVYDVPTFRGVPKILGQGWQLNSLDNVRSGLPVNITTGFSNNYGTPQRPDLVGNNIATIYPQDHSAPNHQLNAHAFTIPTPNPSDPASEFGTLKRNAARGPQFAQFDVSLFKNTPINERISTQFRAEVFNILNHPEFNSPDADLQDSPVFGGVGADNFFGTSQSTINNTIGIGTSRQIQLAFKLMF